MISFIKRLILYFYILITRYRQRYKVLSQLIHNARTQTDVLFESPTLPDAVDDKYEVPDGWSEIHSFVAFDRNGACFVCNNVNGSKRELYITVPAEGTFMYTEKEDEEENTDDGIFIHKRRLKCNVVDPMTKWELSYRGHMKKVTTAEGTTDRSFVIFHLYWRGYRDPYDYWLSMSAWQLATECSKLRFPDSLELLSNKSLWFEQWGELRGTVQIEDREYTFRMPSCRERKFIPKESVELKILRVSSENHEIDGIAHKYGHKSLEWKDGSKLQFCHVLFPSLESYTTNYKKQNNSNVLICFRGKKVRASEQFRRDIIQTEDTSIDYTRYILDNRSASGITYETKPSFTFKDAKAQRRAPEQKQDLSGEKPFVLEISDPLCKNSDLVGSKASNLNALVNFGATVPPAICITTKLFELILKSNGKISESVNHILDMIKAKEFERLKEACDFTCQEFANYEMDPNIEDKIIRKVVKLRSLEERGVAVRSSAIGEDGEVLSAAGQMDTILSVKTKDQLLDAIKQCWASYFSYQSVEYRRQNGQLIVEGMGVIIQEMVQSEVSGAMMTNDPLTGREDRIVVSSCIGLGENVVSGKVDVDTFIIEAQENGHFEMLQKIVGKKISSRESQKELVDRISLSENWINSICSVGKSIEMKFKKELEIEWAIENETLYILQARPITSSDIEKDEDLFHEFDTPLGGERDLLTTCNIQEMMPGASTPLTRSYFVDANNWGFYYVFFYAKDGREKLNHLSGLVLSYGNSYFLNMEHLYVMAANGFGGLKAKIFVDIDSVGEECTESTTEDILNFKGTALNTFTEFLKCTVIQNFVHAPRIIREFHELEDSMNTYSIDAGSNDSKTLYREITSERFKLRQVWKIYFQLLNNQSVAIVKNILMGGLPNFTRDNQEDIAMLLTGSGAMSSDVPKAITRLAKTIESKGLSKSILEARDEEGMTILCQDEETRKSVAEFMTNHGHRGIREAELMEKSWSQDPVKLIKSLKSILSQDAASRDYETDHKEFPIADAMKGLKTRLNPIAKWFIEKVFLPKARNNVLDRERGKSFVLKIFEAFKKAYWSLGDIMVREGRIPDDKLIFFLTHREIGELITTRNPKLIRKAKLRMKIYPQQQAANYERLSFEIPKLKNFAADTTEPLGISETIEGQPMGNGEATGRVCVIMKEEDVSMIQKGDVMVCQYTDVGWSPYFPLISGLVTEIGSILSHGATVARECGIPCVVNVTNATRLLKTGDIVRINGSKGSVEKISESSL